MGSFLCKSSAISAFRGLNRRFNRTMNQVLFTLFSTRNTDAIVATADEPD